MANFGQTSDNIQKLRLKPIFSPWPHKRDSAGSRHWNCPFPRYCPFSSLYSLVLCPLGVAMRHLTHLCSRRVIVFCFCFKYEAYPATFSYSSSCGKINKRKHSAALVLSSSWYLGTASSCPLVALDTTLRSSQVNFKAYPPFSLFCSVLPSLLHHKLLSSSHLLLLFTLFFSCFSVSFLLILASF